MSQRDNSEKIKNLYNVDISDGSAIFYCFDVSVLGLSMDDNMRAELCVRTLRDACGGHPEMRSAIVRSDCGSQHTNTSQSNNLSILYFKKSFFHY